MAMYHIPGIVGPVLAKGKEAFPAWAKAKLVTDLGAHP